MLDFPYLIKKFLAEKMYWENSLAKNSSLILTMAKNPLLASFKVVGSELLKRFVKLSASAVLLNSFTVTDKSFFSFSEVVLKEKPEFWEMSVTKLIATQ